MAAAAAEAKEEWAEAREEWAATAQEERGGSRRRLTISSEKREMNLVPVQLCTSSVSFAVSFRSSGIDISVSVCVIVSKALRYLVRREGGPLVGGTEAGARGIGVGVG